MHHTLIEANDRICNALRNRELSLDEIITLIASLYIMVETVATCRAVEEYGITRLESRDKLKILIEDRIHDCRKFTEYGRREP